MTNTTSWTLVAATDAAVWMEAAEFLGLAGMAFYLLVKWIPEERRADRKARAASQAAFEKALERLQSQHEAALQRERDHAREIVVMVVQQVRDEMRRRDGGMANESG